MTGKDLFAALNFVRDEYVAEAEAEKPARRVIPMKTVRWAGALAACVCLLIGWAFAAQWMQAEADLKTSETAAESTAATTAEGAFDGGVAGGAAEDKTEGDLEEKFEESHAESAEYAVGDSDICGFNIEAEQVEKITVVSMPESAEHERTYTSRGKINKIVAYLNSLTLRADFPENPDEYCGVAYKLTLTMADGTEREFVHFGNMFLREGDGDWLRMTYEEAALLEELLGQMPSD